MIKALQARLATSQIMNIVRDMRRFLLLPAYRPGVHGPRPPRTVPLRASRKHLGKIFPGYSCNGHFNIACGMTMDQGSSDQQLRIELMRIPEIVAAGFSVREGLSGGGVTILKGRTYFGSWRQSMGHLVWISANTSEPHQPVSTVEEAMRQTLLMILRNLQGEAARRPLRRAS